VLDAFLAQAHDDENVIGVVVHGSRARGLYVREGSDWEYVNSYYRSAKNARVGLELAALLDAQESIPYYLDFVFAAHGRVRPYNTWLEWELGEHPLPSEVDLARLERIARTGDLGEQQALFRETEALARSLGDGATIDGWEPDVVWLRG
jgi:predicted nucleotidyltransferase